MIDCLIFSRDRPAQLDACLRSLEQNAPQIAPPHVIVHASTPAFMAGYEEIPRRIQQWEHPDVVEWQFQNLVLNTLRQLGPHVLMLCDDAITYQPVVGNPLEALEDDVICVSLRMGRNTVYCHPRDWTHGAPAPEEFVERPPFIAWPWRGAPGDFGYPYSVDGTIHRRDALLEWIGAKPFLNANQLEGCVVGAVGNREDVPPLIASYPHSCQVGLPINVVNQTHGNRWGFDHPTSTAELNERFLAGERIDFTRMDFSNVIGAHQEIALEWTPAKVTAVST